MAAEATEKPDTQGQGYEDRDGRSLHLSHSTYTALNALAGAAGLSGQELVEAALTCWCHNVVKQHQHDGIRRGRPGGCNELDWSHLPDELAASIMHRLSPVAIRAVRLSCQAWAAQADAHTRHVTVRTRALPIGNDDLVRRGCAATWARMPSLASLTIHHTPSHDAGIMSTLHRAALLPHGALPGLTSLRIETHWRQGGAVAPGSAFGDPHLLLLLIHLRSLRILSIPGSLVTAAGLRDAITAGAMRAITALDLSNASLRNANAALSCLGKLSALTQLRLDGCGLRMGESVAEGLRGLPTGLHLLSIADCGVEDTAASALAALTALTYLDLSCTTPPKSVGRALHGFPADGGRAGQLTDAAMSSLAVLTGLTDLRLAGQARLSCRGLRALRPLSGLTNLDLQACSWGVVTEGVSQLRQFPRLSSLDLSGAPDDIVSLPGQVIAALAGLSVLAELHLRNQFDLTAADLVGLAALPALTSLDLQGCCFRADDEVLPSLGGLTRLKHLGLSRTLDQEISRRPTLLQPLYPLSRLESIDLRGNVLAPLQFGALARLPALTTVHLDPDEAAFDVGGAQLVIADEALRLVNDSLMVWNKVSTRSEQ